MPFMNSRDFYWNLKDDFPGFVDKTRTRVQEMAEFIYSIPVLSPTIITSSQNVKSYYDELREICGMNKSFTLPTETDDIINVCSRTVDSLNSALMLWNSLLRLDGRDIITTNVRNANYARANREYFEVGGKKYEVHYNQSTVSLMEDGTEILVLSQFNTNDTPCTYHVTSDKKIFKGVGWSEKSSLTLGLNKVPYVIENMDDDEIDAFIFQESLVNDSNKEAFYKILSSFIENRVHYNFKTLAVNFKYVIENEFDTVLKVLCQQQESRYNEYYNSFSNLYEGKIRYHIQG